MGQANPDSRNTVLVYRKELLPVSETFVRDQVLALREWRGILVGQRNLMQLPLSGLDVRLLRQERNLRDELAWKSGAILGSVPKSAVNRLRGENASILHVHFGMDAVRAWPLAKALGLPMLVTLHGYDINIDRQWWESGHNGFVMRSYPRRLLQLAAQPNVRFIAVSEAIRRRAIAFGIPAGKIEVLYIGIDPDKFPLGPIPITKRDLRVLFVGRLVEKKGCRYLIEAMAEVQKLIPSARLIVIGDGPERGRLEQMSLRTGVRAEFLGAQLNAEVKKQLDQARVFCLPSVTAENGDAEGFGLVILEAQASGVPVVSSARGGVEEAIKDGVTGFAFEERDVGALTSKLVAALSDDDLASKISSNGRLALRDRFDIKSCTARLEQFYNRVLDPSRQATDHARYARSPAA